MNFIQLYQTLTNKEVKQQLRNKVVIACHIQQSTFYTWIRRGVIPIWHRSTVNQVAANFPELKQLTPEPENQ